MSSIIKNQENTSLFLVEDFFLAIRESIVRPLLRDSYLDGTFKDLITNETHLVDVYTILIDWPFVSGLIKPALFACRKEFIEVRARFPTNSAAIEALVILCSSSLCEVNQHMDNEARSRGLWIPEDNTKDAEGKLLPGNLPNTARFLKFGKVIPDDAPAEFKERQQKYMQMRPENSALMHTVAYRPEDWKLLNSKKENEAGDDKADYGRAFGDNLRRAFKRNSSGNVKVREKAKDAKSHAEEVSEEEIISPEAVKLLATPLENPAPQ